MFNKFRNIAFYTLDKLKGSKVRNALSEISKIEKSESDSNFVKKYQNRKLKILFKYARKTRFYKNFNSNNINDYPVINKNIIRNNQEDFMSEEFNKDKLYKMHTSGSTGTPFVSYQNTNKKKRVHAAVIHYSQKVGYSVGENLIFLRAMTKESEKSKIKQWLQNENLLNISNLSDSDIEKLLIKIKEISKSGSGSMILAYASTYDALKDYFEKHDDSLAKESNITGIISSSEMLYDQTRKILSKAYNYIAP